MGEMKNKKILAKIFIICSLLLAFSFHYGYAQQILADDEAAKEEKCGSAKHHFMKTHINMYYELLAEKYVPDQVKVWQDIQKERKQLKQQLKDLQKKGEVPDLKEQMKPWFQEHQELQKQFTEAIDQRNEGKIKKLLPEIINHQQKLNEIYKQIIDKNASS